MTTMTVQDANKLLDANDWDGLTVGVNRGYDVLRDAVVQGSDAAPHELSVSCPGYTLVVPVDLGPGLLDAARAAAAQVRQRLAP